MRKMFAKAMVTLLCAGLLTGTVTGCGRKNNPGQISPTPIKSPQQNNTKAGLYPAASYDEVINHIFTEALQKGARAVYADSTPEDAFAPNSASDDFNLNSVTENEKTLSDGYSKTNVQVQGVDEADTIKTDGNYFYVLDRSGEKLCIVKAEEGKMTLSATLDFSTLFSDGEYSPSEMYLNGDTLVAMLTGMKNADDSSAMTNSRLWDYYTKWETKTVTVDIKDRTNPKILSVRSQDGSYVSSRMVSGKVYVISNYGTYFYRSAEQKAENCIPYVNDTMMLPEEIYLGEQTNCNRFLVITSMDPNQPEKILDRKAILSGSGINYVSEKYIYLTEEKWDSTEEGTEGNRTIIYRLAYENGKITPAGQGTVKGYLNNQFSLDEYDGYLRAVTTYIGYSGEEDVFYQANGLYVLGPDMEIVGTIENLAENEPIRSARFMGKVGYFVTFRQTDPLFSVDLSNPKEPTVLGELKIPGFSSYLQPYGDNMLLGIGFDADPTTGFTSCVKLSMFDVSNPKDVKEIDRYLLTDFCECAAGYDHKVVLTDLERNLIAFPVESSEYKDNSVLWKNGFVIFGYDKENGFYEKNRLVDSFRFFDDISTHRVNDDGTDLMTAMNSLRNVYVYEHSRGGFIGDDFYLIRPGFEMISYRMSDWTKTDRLCLEPKMEQAAECMKKTATEDYAKIPVYIENPSWEWLFVSSETEGNSVSVGFGEESAPNTDRKAALYQYSLFPICEGRSVVHFILRDVFEYNIYSERTVVVDVAKDFSMSVVSDETVVKREFNESDFDEIKFRPVEKIDFPVYEGENYPKNRIALVIEENYLKDGKIEECDIVAIDFHGHAYQIDEWDPYTAKEKFMDKIHAYYYVNDPVMFMTEEDIAVLAEAAAKVPTDAELSEKGKKALQLTEGELDKIYYVTADGEMILLGVQKDFDEIYTAQDESVDLFFLLADSIYLEEFHTEVTYPKVID